jgi:signal transduction histidine kinase
MPSRSRSLRLKIVLWFVLGFFLIQATLVAGVVFLRREVISRSLEDSLTMSAEAMVDNILAAEVEWDAAEVHALVPAGSGFVAYAVREQDGRVLVAQGVVDVSKLPFTAWEVVRAGPVGGVHTTVSPGRARELTGESHRLRFVTLPFRYRDELYFFQAGVRDQALERLLGPFLDLVVIGVPLGVLAATLAAWVIAARAVSPIHRLSVAARDVSPTNPGERFQVSTTDAEVARLEAELNSALERLEARYRAQDQFISNVSHELKTPIAALLTQAQVAKIGARSLEQGYAFVDKAEVLMKRLGKLVESCLVLARADIGNGPPIHSVALPDVVLGCVQSCKVFAEQQRVRLVPNLVDAHDASPDLTLEGDPELLQTMLENLVLNAISHSPAEGRVALDVVGDAAALRLTVRDEGPGIAAEYLELVFERFVRAPQGGPRSAGTGLGLAIAKGIAHLHGGTIEARNNEGGGCSFVVTLPRTDRGERS